MPAKRPAARPLPDWADELSDEERAELVELEAEGGWMEDETVVTPARKPGR